MKVLAGKTITEVKGIFTTGIASGIKKDNKKDLCIIYSKFKAVSAAVFTVNKAKAAPLLVDIENIKNENTQAIVINSGNANACTGEHKLINAENEDYKTFSEALNFVAIELAKMIAKDGEGSTKFIEAEVINAKTLQDARTLARAVVSSNILKCECF